LAASQKRAITQRKLEGQANLLIGLGVSITGLDAPQVFPDRLEIVRHETAQEMRVWLLEAGLQEQASNQLKLLWSKATVLSGKEKSQHRIVAGEGQGAERKRTTDELSKRSG